MHGTFYGPVRYSYTVYYVVRNRLQRRKRNSRDQRSLLVIIFRRDVTPEKSL